MYIKTHDSESRGQEEAIIRETKNTRPLSELFTRKNSKKFAHALTKPQKQISLSYYRASTFLLYWINKPTMVEAAASVPSWVPAIANLMAFVRAPTHEKPSSRPQIARYYSTSTFNLLGINNPKFTEIHPSVFLHRLLLSFFSKRFFLAGRRFFFFFSFIFFAHFAWACVSLRNFHFHYSIYLFS